VKICDATAASVKRIFPFGTYSGSLRESAGRRSISPADYIPITPLARSTIILPDQQHR
jgi:hypothetical protein